MRTTLTAIAAALYLALNVKGIIILLALYRTAPAAAVILHEWPISALGIAFSVPVVIIATNTLTRQLRYPLWGTIFIADAAAIAGLNALLVPGPITTSVIHFDLLAGATSLAGGLLVVAIMTLNPTP